MSGFGSNPAAFENALLHVRDEKAQGVTGGTFTAGAWRTRDLNTVLTNDIGASLGSNQITLGAGDYFIDAMAPQCGSSFSRLCLYDTTAAAVALLGGTGQGVYNGNENHWDRVQGRFSLAVSSVLELRHWCALTYSTFGFGYQANFAGLIEVYSDVKIWKV